VPEPTHRIVALRTFVYPGPDMKLPALGALSFGSRIALDREHDARHGYRRSRRRRGLDRRLGRTEPTRRRPRTTSSLSPSAFLNVAYLWGGRTSLGLDCSALVQLSLMAAGVPAPRDTDLQESDARRNRRSPADRRKLARGDLVFWPATSAS
jgi:hypothetical protein